MCFRRATFSELALPRRRGVEWSPHALHAKVVQIFGQLSVVVLWVIARLMLPSVAFLALYRVAIVVCEAADAADAVVSSVAM